LLKNQKIKCENSCKKYYNSTTTNIILNQKKLTKDNILVARELKVAQSNNFLKDGKIMLFLLILLREWLI
jgi:hypothetical protein